MDAKQIARLLGAMSIEERVQIIRCLLDAGPDGMQMLDIAARTDLGASAVYKQLESLTGLEIVLVKSVDNNKIYLVNRPQLNELFAYLHRHFGPGLDAHEDTARTDAAAESRRVPSEAA